MVGSGTSDDHLAGYLQCNLLRGALPDRDVWRAESGQIHD